MARSAHGGTAQAADETQAEQAEDPLHITALRYKDEYPDSDAEAIEVSLGVLRTQRTMTAAIGRYLDSLGLMNGISGARYSLMRTLYFARDRRLAQNEIGREMGVSRTNITNLIDGLERDGLVERCASPVDRRVSFAQLTPAGEEALRTLMPAMIQFMHNACAGFSSEDKRTFASLLNRFRRGLEATFASENGLEDDRAP